MKKSVLALCLLLFSLRAHALFEENSPTPIDGLSNPYQLSPLKLQEEITQGRLHALNYPVETTGLLVPYAPTKAALDDDSSNPLRQLVFTIMKGIGRVKSFDDMNAWLGLHPYPSDIGSGAYYVPRADFVPENRMGFTLIERNGATGFTFSCAACHSTELFGQKILGLTNRFPRANQFFLKGKQGFTVVNGSSFNMFTDATPEEIAMLETTKANLKSVEAQNPVQLGLDTSLAHTAVSLSRRTKNATADKSDWFSMFPRTEPLRTHVVDSKPGVWWNVKYKNRWLLDGSVVSGNPILTNLLWNEIGRGSDLKELDAWMTRNQKVIEEFTTAVFASEAPRMTDFFPAAQFNLEKAQAGEKAFEKGRCFTCHGTYQKAWSLESSGSLSLSEKLKTVRVEYPKQTPVKNVGTDPNRFQGMSSLTQLNDLAISKKYGVKVVVQNGYVPPPLVGIWARWPYLHNNSVPSLCALMTPPEERPKTYYSGEAINPQTDFDFACNGYPSVVPETWKQPEYLFDTSKPSSSNMGHYARIFTDDQGNEKFTPEEKSALIAYLQTL